MTRPLHLVALLLAAFLLATPLPAPSPARPALWVVRDGDTTIWLFGSVHALPPRIGWFAGPVRRAFEASDTLVLETLAPDAAEAARVRSALAGPDGAPDPWVQVVAVQGARLEALGHRSANGVEARLLAEAGAKRRVVLEGFAAQLARIDAIPAEAQRRWLERAKASPGDPAELVRLWARGDVAALDRLVAKETGSDPVLAEALVARPNRAWSDWITQRMARPGTVFVAVGAGHLAGQGSIVARLRDKGLAVERVQ